MRGPVPANSRVSPVSTHPTSRPRIPDLVLDTTGADIDQLVAQVIELLNQKRAV